MRLMKSYKISNGYISDMSRSAEPLEGWLSFETPIEVGNCMVITDELIVDFVEQRARYITPTSFGQSQEDPGTPPDPSVALATVAACQAWVSRLEAGVTSPDSRRQRRRLSFGTTSTSRRGAQHLVTHSLAVN